MAPASDAAAEQWLRQALTSVSAEHTRGEPSRHHGAATLM